jgi:hypothetical protein
MNLPWKERLETDGLLSSQHMVQTAVYYVNPGAVFCGPEMQRDVFIVIYTANMYD